MKYNSNTGSVLYHSKMIFGKNKKNLLSLPAEFDYNLLLHALRDYKKSKDKIRGLVRDKDIMRVKKGLYVLGKEYNKPYNRFVLANLIYGPSYITDRFGILEHDTGTC